MKAFIRKEQFNGIHKYMQDFVSQLKFCPDKQIIEANRVHYELQIIGMFDALTEEQMEQLTLHNIKKVGDVEAYLLDLKPYVYGMYSVSEFQLKKLFRKEKRLKLPDEERMEADKVYLGWHDPGEKKLYMAYYMDHELLGMTCRVQPTKPAAANICKLCNHAGFGSEVAFVSPVCKTSESATYRSVGFNACLDSQACNERITSTTNLEKLFRKVNGLDE